MKIEAGKFIDNNTCLIIFSSGLVKFMELTNGEKTTTIKQRPSTARPGTTASMKKEKELKINLKSRKV